jgi:pimeloyl-ACP methyl ester carboxylesterase/DNA-binding CsgD family transcriptional regulator
MSIPSTTRFCRLPDGMRVAYATNGSGRPLVMVPGWLCHLDGSWSHPSAASARARFAAEHAFTWYDRLGCGLSDRQGFEVSLENDVDQLIAVLDSAGIERASLIGYSLGGPPATVFASRFPDRVDRLVLYSAFARGASVTTPEGFDALQQVVAMNWKIGSRTLATMLLPNAGSRDLRWFARFQTAAARAEMAATLIEHMRTMDVREVLPRVRIPTLVLHNRDDRAIPLDAGRELVALLPNARLQVLDGNEHDPFIRDSGDVVDAILDFVNDRPPLPRKAATPPANRLTARECEVLRLIAIGTSNKRIAAELGIAVTTVERHVTNLYRKIGAKGRADAALSAVTLGLVSPGPSTDPRTGYPGPGTRGSRDAYVRNAT